MNDPRMAVPIYLKYALRCLTSCIRSNTAISVLVNDTNGLNNVLEFLEYSKDEEVQANCAKIIRITLREDIYYEKVTSVNSDLGNLLLRNVNKFIYSDIVLAELIAAIRNFSRSAPKIAFIQKQNVNVLIKIVKMPPNEKI